MPTKKLLNIFVLLDNFLASEYNRKNNKNNLKRTRFWFITIHLFHWYGYLSAKWKRQKTLNFDLNINKIFLFEYANKYNGNFDKKISKRMNLFKKHLKATIFQEIISTCFFVL